MALGDVTEVAALESRVFPDPWSPDSFLAEVERRPDVGWPVVVRDGATIVGYAVVWFIVDEIHIGNLAVHPDRQGEGIGKWLMERILEEGKNRAMVFATLEVRPSNRAALALYQGFGFRKIAVRRRYYRNNDEDAWVLAIALDPSAESRLG
jgi:ribosomal-protein-alanine N-acetyltransferase